jgi:hypothetical protein
MKKMLKWKIEKSTEGTKKMIKWKIEKSTEGMKKMIKWKIEKSTEGNNLQSTTLAERERAIEALRKNAQT